jgi:hypothetical protein
MAEGPAPASMHLRWLQYFTGMIFSDCTITGSDATRPLSNARF